LLRIASNIIENENQEIQNIIANEGFNFDLSRTPYRTLLLDLTPSLEDLRKNLNQKWRNQLNREEKNELKVIEGNSNELYNKFLQLQKEMQARKGYKPDVDYEEFGKIQQDLPES